MKTARYTIEHLRRESVQLAPCYGCHRQRVRADLAQCSRCGMWTCDRCNTKRVTETARTLADGQVVPGG